MKPSPLLTSGGVRRHTARGMKKITKAALVGGAAAAAIAATMGVAAPANASEGSYLQALNNSGLTIYNAGSAVNAGLAVCAELRLGYTYSQEAWSLVQGAYGPYGDGNYTFGDGIAQVAAAHNHLCPSVYAYKV